MNAVLCQQKDCERTDATPVYMTIRSPEGEVQDKRTFHFCRDHREQLLALDGVPTLPPAEWFGEAEQADPTA